MAAPAPHETESVRVFCRIRPPDDFALPIEQREHLALSVTDPSGTVVDVNVPNLAKDPSSMSKFKAKKLKFRYDRVFDHFSGQDDVFRETLPLVDAVLEGYHSTILAYGQSGSGKTYTMEGPDFTETAPVTTAQGATGGSNTQGIIPRAIEYLFDAIARDPCESKRFLVRATYVEIYNESVYDLLSPNPFAHPLPVTERRAKDGFEVQNVTDATVANAAELRKVFQRGRMLRRQAATVFNDRSSRSHAIFTIYVETATTVMPDASASRRSSDEDDDELNSDGLTVVKVGKLNCVDLAGCERLISPSVPTGGRLRETTTINSSLLVLSRCIVAIGALQQQQQHLQQLKLASPGGPGADSVEEQQQPHYVPFRSSKLTMLLKDSLGGNSKTLVIATCRPEDKYFESTQNTLRFASQLKLIKNRPTVHMDMKEAKLRRLQQQLLLFQRLLERGDVDALDLAIRQFQIELGGPLYGTPAAAQPSPSAPHAPYQTVNGNSNSDFVTTTLTFDPQGGASSPNLAATKGLPNLPAAQTPNTRTLSEVSHSDEGAMPGSTAPLTARTMSGQEVPRPRPQKNIASSLLAMTLRAAAEQGMRKSLPPSSPSPRSPAPSRRNERKLSESKAAASSTTSGPTHKPSRKPLGKGETNSMLVKPSKPISLELPSETAPDEPEHASKQPSVVYTPRMMEALAAPSPRAGSQAVAALLKFGQQTALVSGQDDLSQTREPQLIDSPTKANNEDSSQLNVNAYPPASPSALELSSTDVETWLTQAVDGARADHLSPDAEMGTDTSFVEPGLRTPPRASSKPTSPFPYGSALDVTDVSLAAFADEVEDLTTDSGALEPVSEDIPAEPTGGHDATFATSEPEPNADTSRVSAADATIASPEPGGLVSSGELTCDNALRPREEEPYGLGTMEPIVNATMPQSDQPIPHVEAHDSPSHRAAEVIRQLRAAASVILLPGVASAVSEEILASATEATAQKTHELDILPEGVNPETIALASEAAAAAVVIGMRTQTHTSPKLHPTPSNKRRSSLSGMVGEPGPMSLDGTPAQAHEVYTKGEAATEALTVSDEEASRLDQHAIHAQLDWLEQAHARLEELRKRREQAQSSDQVNATPKAPPTSPRNRRASMPTLHGIRAAVASNLTKLHVGSPLSAALLEQAKQALAVAQAAADAVALAQRATQEVKSASDRLQSSIAASHLGAEATGSEDDSDMTKVYPASSQEISDVHMNEVGATVAIPNVSLVRLPESPAEPRTEPQSEGRIPKVGPLRLRQGGKAPSTASTASSDWGIPITILDEEDEDEEDESEDSEEDESEGGEVRGQTPKIFPRRPDLVNSTAFKQHDEDEEEFEVRMERIETQMLSPVELQATNGGFAGHPRNHHNVMNTTIAEDQATDSGHKEHDPDQPVENVDEIVGGALEDDLDEQVEGAFDYVDADTEFTSQYASVGPLLRSAPGAIHRRGRKSSKKSGPLDTPHGSSSRHKSNRMKSENVRQVDEEARKQLRQFAAAQASQTIPLGVIGSDCAASKLKLKRASSGQGRVQPVEEAADKTLDLLGYAAKRDGQGSAPGHKDDAAISLGRKARTASGSKFDDSYDDQEGDDLTSDSEDDSESEDGYDSSDEDEDSESSEDEVADGSPRKGASPRPDTLEKQQRETPDDHKEARQGTTLPLSSIGMSRLYEDEEFTRLVLQIADRIRELHHTESKTSEQSQLTEEVAGQPVACQPNSQSKSDLPTSPISRSSEVIPDMRSASRDVAGDAAPKSESGAELKRIMASLGSIAVQTDAQQNTRSHEPDADTFIKEDTLAATSDFIAKSRSPSDAQRSADLRDSTYSSQPSVSPEIKLQTRTSSLSPSPELDGNPEEIFAYAAMLKLREKHAAAAAVAAKTTTPTLSGSSASGSRKPTPPSRPFSWSQFGFDESSDEQQGADEDATAGDELEEGFDNFLQSMLDGAMRSDKHEHDSRVNVQNHLAPSASRFTAASRGTTSPNRHSPRPHSSRGSVTSRSPREPTFTKYNLPRTVPLATSTRDSPSDRQSGRQDIYEDDDLPRSAKSSRDRNADGSNVFERLAKQAEERNRRLAEQRAALARARLMEQLEAEDRERQRAAAVARLVAAERSQRQLYLSQSYLSRHEAEQALQELERMRAAQLPRAALVDSSPPRKAPSSSGSNNNSPQPQRTTSVTSSHDEHTFSPRTENLIRNYDESIKRTRSALNSYAKRQ